MSVVSTALVTRWLMPECRGKILTGAFGESRPKCNESTEACWQSDRRVEVLIGTDTASR